MLELYLISVFDSVRTFAMVTIGIDLFLVFALFVCFLNEDRDRDLSRRKRPSKLLLVTIVISSIALMFIPPKRDMYMIFGVGGVFDYLRENDTAKQIPDKCLMLIDKWIDEEINNESDINR